MGLAQKIRLMMVIQGNMSEAELARRLGQSPSNFNGKMKRDNFSEEELLKIAAALDCELKINFLAKTGEKV
jgi:DNA-binding Xre family transcriptional regulator